MRKLATIQKILDIKPIEGADRIEVATILGWHVVIKKGEFKVGDLCVYFEVDSLLPPLPEFDFLKSTGIKSIIGEDHKEHSGYRLKTIKLRKQISQGLAFPTTILKRNHKEGDDVTDELGVIKYERFIESTNMPSHRVPIIFPDWLPVQIGIFIKRLSPKLAVLLWGRRMKPFPSFIPKTDETRIQNFPSVLTRHKDKIFYMTEKLDGSSITVFHKNGELGVCSRSILLPRDIENKFWKPIIALNIEEKLAKMGNFAIQGELVGESIQENKLNIKGQKVYFFNVYNINTGKYLDYNKFTTFCKELGVETVPVISDSFSLMDKVDDMVTVATRKSMINQNTWTEGIILRPLVESTDEDLGRLSFKVINPEFLLAEK